MAAVLTAGDGDRRFVIPKHIEVISDKLADAAFNQKYLIITLPPRHGKSELVSKWFPFWFLSLFPHKQVLFGSYGADFARKWGLSVMDLVLLYGQQFDLYLNPRMRAGDEWLLDNGRGGMTTKGMDSSFTGRGADVLLIDDPIKDAADAASPVMRDRAWEWWLRTAHSRLEPRASVVLIQTRWHEDDLAGRLLERMGMDGRQWDVVNLPALAEENDLLGREVGEPLWPERYSKQYLLDLQRDDPNGFAALYQQRPTPAEGHTIKKEWFREYDPADLFLEDGPMQRGWDLLIQSWDMNLGGVETKRNVADFTVGQVWGLYRANFYLLDQVRGRWDAKEALGQVRALSVKWPEAKAKIIEAKAMGPSAIAILRDEIPGMLPFVPQTSKEARVQAIAYLIQAGNVRIPSNATWKETFLHEWGSFPKGANDDIVDCSTQSLLYLEPKKRQGITGSQFQAHRYVQPPKSLEELRQREVRKILDDAGKPPRKFGLSDLRRGRRNW